jgi:hypothetical protein
VHFPIFFTFIAPDLSVKDHPLALMSAISLAAQLVKPTKLASAVSSDMTSGLPGAKHTYENSSFLIKSIF